MGSRQEKAARRAAEKSPGKRRKKSIFREYAESILVAVLAALFLRTFIIEAFKIPSASMVPTLEIGDFIFVNKFIYGVRVPFTDYLLIPVSEPERGDIIVFRYPDDPDIDYIKRVVGIPGDIIQILDNELYVNTTRIEREYVRGYEYIDPSLDEVVHDLLQYPLGKLPVTHRHPELGTELLDVGTHALDRLDPVVDKEGLSPPIRLPE